MAKETNDIQYWDLSLKSVSGKVLSQTRTFFRFWYGDPVTALL